MPKRKGERSTSRSVPRSLSKSGQPSQGPRSEAVSTAGPTRLQNLLDRHREMLTHVRTQSAVHSTTNLQIDSLTNDTFWIPELPEDANLDDCRLVYTLHLASRTPIFLNPANTAYSLTHRNLSVEMIENEGEAVPAPWRQIIWSALTDETDLGIEVRSSLRQVFDELMVPPSDIPSKMQVGTKITYKVPIDEISTRIVKMSIWEWMKKSEKAFQRGISLGQYHSSSVRGRRRG